MRGGGGHPAGLSFFTRGLQFLCGPLPRNFKYNYRSSQLKLSRLPPFLSNLGQRGVCGHVQKSEVLGCRPRGSQANGAAIHSKRPGLC